MQAGKDVEDQRQDDAQQDGGSQGEVHGGVFAAPGEVAGKAAEGQTGPAEEQDDCADGDEEQSDADEETAEVAHVFSVRQLKSGWLRGG